MQRCPTEMLLVPQNNNERFSDDSLLPTGLKGHSSQGGMGQAVAVTAPGVLTLQDAPSDAHLLAGGVLSVFEIPVLSL